MADDADLTDLRIAAETELTLAVIRKQVEPKYAETCDLCGDDLIEFRKPFGRCIDCQERIEIKAKVGLSGAVQFYQRPGDDEDE
jgi:hypothetical protein